MSTYISCRLVDLLSAWPARKLVDGHHHIFCVFNIDCRNNLISSNEFQIAIKSFLSFIVITFYEREKMKFSCAAQHLCKAKHLEVSPTTKCKECNKYMHHFCTGLAIQPSPSYLEAHGGYTCAKCANELMTSFFTSPRGRAMQSTNSPLLPLPIQQTAPTPSESTPVTMLGDIPVYHTLGNCNLKLVCYLYLLFIF